MAQLATWWSRLLATATVAATVWWPWLPAGIAAIALLVFAWWLWWRLPKRQVHRLRFAIRDAKARADVEDNFRKTIGQLLGGAAVLIGAGFAYVQFQQQQQAAHDVLISNQVAKGFELLGHKDKDEVRMRLGGIYALEGVMNASDQYHQPVLETLCAFVRDQPQTSNDAPPATDIQAALTVIGRRKPGLGEVDLSGAHIVKASLIGADLSHADLSHADLSHADLSHADLSHADLRDADLSQLGGPSCSSLGWRGRAEPLLSEVQTRQDDTPRAPRPPNAARL